MSSVWTRIAGLSGASSIGLAAYGAHGLKVDATLTKTFENGNRLHVCAHCTRFCAFHMCCAHICHPPTRLPLVMLADAPLNHARHLPSAEATTPQRRLLSHWNGRLLRLLLRCGVHQGSCKRPLRSHWWHCTNRWMAHACALTPVTLHLLPSCLISVAFGPR